MTSPSFLPYPAGLTPTQQREWDQRRQLAEHLLAQPAATPPDAEMLAHLQPYVRGEITLGQAVGRLLDHQARR